MNEKWVAALFSKFQVRYGAKWTSALSSPELIRLAVDEWATLLAGVTGEQIGRGLDVWKGDWPPSANEFCKLCLEAGDGLHNTRAYRRFKLLPKPDVDRAVGRGALERMAGGLRGMKG